MPDTQQLDPTNPMAEITKGIRALLDHAEELAKSTEVGVSSVVEDETHAAFQTIRASLNDATRALKTASTVAHTAALKAASVGKHHGVTTKSAPPS